MSGESAGVNIDTVDDHNRRILDIVQGYSPDNIFNCDKTGLFFRALPDKTLSVNSDNTKGSRTSKERVTIMFACSALGEKCKPLVITKAQKPCCVKNIHLYSLSNYQ